MKIRIWKPGENGNPSDRRYYYQFFLRKKRYRGIQKIWDDAWNNKYDPEPHHHQYRFCVRILSEIRIYLGPRSTKAVTMMMCA